MSILDCHTHHSAPQPEGIICLTPQEFCDLDKAGALLSEQAYSVGIHPWATLEAPSETLWELMEQAADSPMTVAIGEAGIDTIKGGPMFRQLQVLIRQVEISEKVVKPLLLHDVKAHDVIIGLKRDLAPTQPWIIHGFRGKPSVARMLLDAGMYLSFGEKFNPEALSLTPSNRLLAETDESSLSITEIIAVLSSAAGRDLTGEIAVLSAQLFATKS